MIGGFIITGNGPKRVLIRGIGPSLEKAGITQPLLDPILALHGPDGSLIFANNDWRDSQQTDIETSTLAPVDDREAAIIAILQPGSYTAIVSGNNNTTGAALVEIYDLDGSSANGSRLANISTRGFVSTGDGVMIAGIILEGGTAQANLIVRGLGPSLTLFGIANPLLDPTIDLYDAHGSRVLFNDNWDDDPVQVTQLEAAGFAPASNRESALVVSLPAGAYTAVLAGNNDSTGVGLIEVYNTD